MCNFRVGQKVVALNSAWFNPVDGVRVDPSLPEMGKVYTVCRVISEPDGAFLELAECEPFSIFLSSNFRPVADRKTDISQFKAMLNPSKEGVSA